MKRKYFNLGLYLDSLRRTALVGGLFTALMCIQSFIVAIGFFVAGNDIKYRMAGVVNITTVGLLEINPMIFAIPLLMVPFLMLTLFGFLTKRSTSDFWHSVPFSRPCLYNTFILAALSWAVIAMLLSSVISVVGFLMMPQFYAVNFVSVLYVFISVLAIVLLTTGAFSISSGVTGTYFNNVIVATVILFLPRAFLYFFNEICSNASLFPNVIGGEDSLSVNLLFGAFLGSAFGTGDMTETMTNVGSIIYTLILGIVYISIGLILFKKRKSETASLSAVNKYIQAALRITVSMVVCLIPIYMICKNDITDSSDLFLVFVVYVIAVIAYFLYELITTKKAKNMLKCVPSLWILAVINIVVIASATLIYNAEFSYTPTAETVKSIRIYDTNDKGDYFNKKMSKLQISDDELEEFLCDLYSNTRKKYNNKTLTTRGHTTINVMFKSGLTEKYRRIYLSESEYARLGELLDKNEDVKSIYDIDSLFDNAVHSSINIYATDIEMTEAQHKALLDAYIKDIKKMSFSEWYAIANNARRGNYYYAEADTVTPESKQANYYQLGNVSASINLSGNTYYVDFPLTNRTQTAYNLAMGTIYEYQQEKGLVTKLITKMQSGDSSSASIYVTLYNGKTKAPTENYSIYKNVLLSNKFVEAVTPALSDKPDATSRIAVVEYYDIDRAKETGENIRIILKVPDDADLTFLLGETKRIQ